MYDIEVYSREIYRIVSGSSQQRGTIFLDFANEDHYRCVNEMFGGEDRFKRIFQLIIYLRRRPDRTMQQTGQWLPDPTSRDLRTMPRYKMFFTKNPTSSFIPVAT